MSRLKNQADSLKASVTAGGRIHESVQSAIELISQLAGKMDAEDRELAQLRREIEELKSWKESQRTVDV
jgi:hypothetical protein